MKTVSEESVGGRVRKARIDNGMTLKDLAEKADVSLNHLSLVERGDKRASTSLLKRIADVTKVPYVWLESGTANKPVQPTEQDNPQIDIQLLLTLIQMGDASKNAEYLASVLTTTPETINAIMSGEDTANRPLWQQSLKLLSRQLDISTLCGRLEDFIRYLKDEKNTLVEERHAVLEKALKQYYEREYGGRIERCEPMREAATPLPETRMFFELCNYYGRRVEFHCIDFDGSSKSRSDESAKRDDGLIQLYIEESFDDFSAENCQYFVVWEEKTLFDKFVEKINCFSLERLEKGAHDPAGDIHLVNALLINPETFEILDSKECCPEEVNRYRETLSTEW